MLGILIPITYHKLSKSNILLDLVSSILSSLLVARVKFWWDIKKGKVIFKQVFEGFKEFLGE